MSFAQGTLHYNLPITNGSDKRTWFDTNEAFIEIDAAIWEAAQSAAAAATTVEALTTQVGTLSETVQTVANSYIALSGSVNTLSEVVQGHTLNIQQLQTATANKADSVAIADAYNPNLTYSVGDVVMYDGQRYSCITAVTTGEPFDQDKWQGEDVQTVLDDIISDLTDLELSNNSTITDIKDFSNVGPDTHTITTDGLYQLSLSVGATAAVANLKMAINDITLLLLGGGLAYNATSTVVYLKSGSVITYTGISATSVGHIRRITN